MASAVFEAEYEAAVVQLTAINAALLAFSSDGVQSYTLDTGQTRVTKTRADISSLETRKQKLLNEISVLEIRLGKCPSTHYGRPAF